jgi:hypothetical protein
VDCSQTAMETSTSRQVTRVLSDAPLPAQDRAALSENRRKARVDLCAYSVHASKAAGGWRAQRLCDAEQRSGAGSARLRAKSDMFEALYSGPSCRTCPAQRAAQGSRPYPADRRSEAEPVTRLRLCSRRTRPAPSLARDHVGSASLGAAWTKRFGLQRNALPFPP